MNFGKRLKEVLKNRGVKHAHIAQKMGITPQNFYHHTKQEDMRLSVAVKICDELGITVQEFVDGD